MKSAKGITYKVVIILIISIVISVSCIETFYLLSRRSNIIKEIETNATLATERISYSVMYPLWNMNVSEVSRFISMEMTDPNIMAIVITSYDESLLAGQIRYPGTPVRMIDLQTDQESLTKSFLSIERNISYHGEYLGKAKVYLTDLPLKTQIRNLIMGSMIQVLLLCGVIVLAIFISLRKIILKPLIDLTSAASGLGRGDFSINLEQKSDDELGTLAQTINTAAKELDANFRHQLLLYDQLKDKRDSLKLSEEKYRTIFNASNDGIALKDAEDGHIIEINDKMLKMLGYTRDEILEVPIDSLYAETPPHTLDDGLRIEKAAALGPQQIEWRVKKKNGEHIWVDVHVQLVSFWNKESVLLVVRDINDRKLSEEALKENERMLATLMSNLPGMVFRCLNDRDWSMQLVSEGCRDLLGCEPEELTEDRLSFNDMIHPDDRQYVWDAIQEALDEHQHYQINYRVRKTDGNIIWVWEKGRGTYAEDGQILFLEGFITDVTELKQKDQQLVQAQKMEAIGTLVGGIAHDINNILTAIIGYAEIIAEDSVKNSTLHEYTEQIINAGGRARDLVKQILTFSRQVEITKEPVQIHLIVKEALKLLQASIPTTITIRQDVDPSSGLIMASPTQIHQVIVNLCTNAYQAMGEDGGILSVSLNPVQLDHNFAHSNPPLQEGEYIRLMVNDTGSGIDKTIQERIFDPFFTTKRKGVGTGLGLATVHGIVTELNGSISVESEPGEGTSITVYLPKIKNRSSINSEKKPINIPAGKGEHILIIDDDHMLLKMTDQMLRKIGYRVTAKHSSREALDTFMKDPDSFDIIFTDQVMPEMTGAQLAKKILAVRPEIPIIIATGFSEKIDPESARALGIRKFIQKPFTRTILAETIREVIEESGE